MTTDSLFLFLIGFAGFLQWCVGSVNFFAPKKLHYRKNLQHADLFIRQVFNAYIFYITFILFSMGLFCLLFPEYFYTKSSLGKALTLYYALFWTIRVLTQFFYYDKETKRTYPFYNILFTLTFLYLSILFIYLALTQFCGELF